MEKMQTLRKENLQCAKNIYFRLKEEKCLNRKEIIEEFLKGKKNLGRGPGLKPDVDSCSPYNYETTFTFLRQHGLMTRHTINGLVIYVATQKCVRTHSFENATRIVTEITNARIDKAIDYQTINNGEVNLADEAIVIARILKIERRSHKNLFIKAYQDAYEALKIANAQAEKSMHVPSEGIPMKMAILSVIRDLPEFKKV